jgi:methylglutaconyl-CoA hydratase
VSVENESVLLEEVREGVAIWTLNRPERSNALSRALLTTLAERAEALHGRRDVRALIITGAGDKAFCAGADLKERKDMSIEDVRAFLPLYDAAFSAIDDLDKPVIAALNGVAFGGGLELALACDLRVMHRAARVGLTETSLGIIPGAGGTQRLPRIVGEARAKQLILLSERIAADEALRIGLVQRITEPDQSALACALELCEVFRNGAPIALAAALDAIDAASDLPLDEGLAYERQCYERTLASKDRVEALNAFAEKRPPKFRGE